VTQEGKEIKITDKRMFTPDGELREEYRFLGEKSTSAEAAAEAAPGAPSTASGASPTVVSRPEPEPAAPRSAAGSPPPGYPAESSARLEIPGSPPGMGPSFYDLAAVLAEPIPIYLGDVELPDGQTAENMEMARLYIDLLDVLRQKTAGNLSAQESSFLEDLLYRSRVRYVQKRG
jgi:Domain of unknown function (DUF1844)